LSTIYIGVDDTDTLGTRGTGHLARMMAAELGAEMRVLGVTRHQLLVDTRVPCTKNNSAAAIHVDDGADADLDGLFERARRLMLADFITGSDPGLCVARAVPAGVTAYGRRVKGAFVTRDEAREVAAAHGVRLEGLGGTQDGVIGALAAVGLAAGGDDGRYVLVGHVRDLSGLLPVSALRDAGIEALYTPDGQPVTTGRVLVEKLRPARRSGRPVLFVERDDDHWRPLKLD
jgi:tRNA(Ile2) C34 agmatinyltransferase TiaS